MRPAPSREEAMALMGRRRYERYYAGPQFEYERERVEMLCTAYWNGGTVDSRWHDTELAEDDLTMDGYLEHLKEASKIGKDKAQAHARKAYVDPAEQNNWPAYRMDLENGLRQLDKRTVACLELHYGWGWTHQQVAAELSVARQRVGQLIDAGVSLLTAHMNGDE